MYLWLVLATFLAMIAAYLLPIRADTQEAVIVPVAQARLMQMIVKEEAGKQFMHERAYPYYSNDSERKVGYTSGEIDVSDYLPFGFIDNNEYVTAIYCMDEAMTQILTGEDACRRIEGTKKWRMLITYGPIPEQWQSINLENNGYDIRPSTDMMAALRNQFGRNEMVGYVVNEGGKLYVVNYEGIKFEVPQPVVNNIGMSNYGIKDCINDHVSCLAYMSWR